MSGSREDERKHQLSVAAAPHVRRPPWKFRRHLSLGSKSLPRRIHEQIWSLEARWWLEQLPVQGLEEARSLSLEGRLLWLQYAVHSLNI
jgi:hypothetical protein